METPLLQPPPPPANHSGNFYGGSPWRQSDGVAKGGRGRYLSPLSLLLVILLIKSREGSQTLQITSIYSTSLDNNDITFGFGGDFNVHKIACQFCDIDGFDYYIG